MNSRVDLHAIDATPARWRGGVGSSPLDGIITDTLVDFHSTVMRSPRNDLVKNYRVHPTHWLISTQPARAVVHGVGRVHGRHERDVGTAAEPDGGGHDAGPEHDEATATHSNLL